MSYKVTYLGSQSSIYDCSIIPIKKTTPLNESTLSMYLSATNIQEVNLGLSFSNIFDSDGNRVCVYKIEGVKRYDFDAILFIPLVTSLSELRSGLIKPIGFIEFPLMNFPKNVRDLYLSIDILSKGTELFTEIPKYLFDYLPMDTVTNLGILGDLAPLDNTESLTSNIRYTSGSKELDTEVMYGSNSWITGNKVYEVPPLDLDLNGVEVVSSTCIQHGYEEYLRIEDSLGRYYLVNVSTHPNKQLIQSHSSGLVYAESDSVSTVLLNPDYIVFLSKTTKTKYRMSIVDYISSNLFNLSDLLASNNSDLTLLSRSVSVGTDIASTDVTTIYSNSSMKDSWCYQYKVSEFLKKNPRLDYVNYKYELSQHNLRFFVIKEYTTLGILNKILVIDSRGRSLSKDPLTKIFLNIDGTMIIEEEDSYLIYLDDLTTKVQSSTLDILRGIYLSSTPFILPSNLKSESLLLVRDRIQSI